MVECVDAVDNRLDRATDSLAVLKVVDAVDASLLLESEAEDVGLGAGEEGGGRSVLGLPLCAVLRIVDVLDLTDATDGALDFRLGDAAGTGGRVIRGPTPGRFEDVVI